MNGQLSQGPESSPNVYTGTYTYWSFRRSAAVA